MLVQRSSNRDKVRWNVREEPTTMECVDHNLGAAKSVDTARLNPWRAKLNPKKLASTSDIIEGIDFA